MRHFPKLFFVLFFCTHNDIFSQNNANSIDLPDLFIKEAYEKAGSQNILAAVNHKVFFGYFSVCADGLVSKVE